MLDAVQKASVWQIPSQCPFHTAASSQMQPKLQCAQSYKCHMACLTHLQQKCQDHFGLPSTTWRARGVSTRSCAEKLVVKEVDCCVEHLSYFLSLRVILPDSCGCGSVQTLSIDYQFEQCNIRMSKPYCRLAKTHLCQACADWLQYHVGSP